jgi:hypothetical protein
MTDLAAIGAACGVADTRVVEDRAGLEAVAARVKAIGSGTMIAVVGISGEEKPRCLPPRDGARIKTRLRMALGVERCYRPP